MDDRRGVWGLSLGGPHYQGFDLQEPQWVCTGRSSGRGRGGFLVERGSERPHNCDPLSREEPLGSLVSPGLGGWVQAPVPAPGAPVRVTAQDAAQLQDGDTATQPDRHSPSPHLTPISGAPASSQRIARKEPHVHPRIGGVLRKTATAGDPPGHGRDPQPLIPATTVNVHWSPVPSRAHGKRTVSLPSPFPPGRPRPTSATDGKKTVSETK